MPRIYQANDEAFALNPNNLLECLHSTQDRIDALEKFKATIAGRNIEPIFLEQFLTSNVNRDAIDVHVYWLMHENNLLSFDKYVAVLDGRGVEELTKFLKEGFEELPLNMSIDSDNDGHIDTETLLLLGSCANIFLFLFERAYGERKTKESSRNFVKIIENLSNVTDSSGSLSRWVSLCTLSAFHCLSLVLCRSTDFIAVGMWKQGQLYRFCAYNVNICDMPPRSNKDADSNSLLELYELTNSIVREIILVTSDESILNCVRNALHSPSECWLDYSVYSLIRRDGGPSIHPFFSLIIAAAPTSLLDAVLDVAARTARQALTEECYQLLHRCLCLAEWVSGARSSTNSSSTGDTNTQADIKLFDDWVNFVLGGIAVSSPGATAPPTMANTNCGSASSHYIPSVLPEDSFAFAVLALCECIRYNSLGNVYP